MARGQVALLRAVAHTPMVLHTMTVHPRGILPAQAAKAWYLRVKAKKKWREIKAEVVNAAGGTPSMHAYGSEYLRTPSLGPVVRRKTDHLAWARMGTDGCRGCTVITYEA